MHCKICQSATTTLFRARVLGKHDVGFHRCTACGFMQTDTPYWLDEAYASAINEVDLGPVNRAVHGVAAVEGVILTAFDREGRFVDFGGGYGLLVRMMRDRGFDFRWHDPHCQNLFARHFVARPGERHEMVTAFEVFEHLADPLAGVEEMLGFADAILFSTLIAPKRDEAVRDWWYLGLDHGQHIAFYTIKALEVVARRHGLHLSSDGAEVHMLSRRRYYDRALRFFVRDSAAAQLTRWALRRRMRRASLLVDDFREVSGYNV